MDKLYGILEIIFDDKVLALVCLTVIALGTMFCDNLSDLQITVIIAVVSAIGGLAVGRVITKGPINPKA
jgi:multisubunit Na+/H+ antiporter MnhF subunit